MTSIRTSVLVIFAFLVLQPNPELSAQSYEADVFIAFSQQRIVRDPDDFSNYNALASAYMQKARETGDVSYYDRAENALKKSLALVPGHNPAAIATSQLAAVHLAKHQFRQAQSLAQQALRLDPSTPAPYAVIGDAALEMGEYKQAAEAYHALRMHRHAVLVDDRLSYVQFLHGRSQQAIHLMQQAVEKARVTKSFKEHEAWSQTQLGELYFATGNLKLAEQAYAAALVVYPQYHRALAALARVHAARGSAQQAIASYQQAITIIPLPEYIGALGDLYTFLNQIDEAKKQYALIEYMATLNERTQVLYNRELALFYADHDQQLTKALTLATKELEVRRDIYTYDVLAWVLYKNNRLHEAHQAMVHALRLGTQDARLFFHAGMIAHRRGEHAQARHYLRLALKTNPHFSLFGSVQAKRTLATLAKTLTLQAE